MDAKPYSDEELAELRQLARLWRIDAVEQGGSTNGLAECERFLATIAALRAEAAANVKTALDACDEEQMVRRQRDGYRAALETISRMSSSTKLRNVARAALEGK
jgi:hypothetical protein